MLILSEYQNRLLLLVSIVSCFSLLVYRHFCSCNVTHCDAIT